MRGLVFDIQRFSTHDGPGIRTTAFLKGCPLRCYWCHNPESIRPEPELLFWREKCIGCFECLKACPRGAHGKTDGMHAFDRERCTGCGSCAGVCPSGALTISGQWMEPRELLNEFLQDRAFFEKSGGGATFSGGEALLQPGFLLETLRLCKDAGLHTAVDTCGEVPWEHFEPILPYTDLFLYDVKPAPAPRATGNLRMLSESGISIQIRVPVIPGENDTPEAMISISGTIHGLSVALLPFHKLGAGKYRALGVSYAAESLTPPDGKTMSGLADILRGAGCSVEISR